MKVKNNSKYIKKNDIFICTHTEFENRHKYIQDAIDKKTNAVIVDEDVKNIKEIPIIKVNNTNETYFQIYNDYYGHPFNNIKLVGITGTDGKTTTASITKQLLSNFYKTAYLGTNGLEYNDKVIKTKNTTPDITEILRIGKLLKEENIEFLVMEASSEGLLNNRLEGLEFDICAITNITSEHLNVHKNQKNYVYSKLKLFKKVKKNGISILNKNDKYYYLFRKKIKRKITYGEKLFSNYRIKNIKEFETYTIFKLKHKNKVYNIKSPYVGKFNVYNLVLSMIIVNKLGISMNEIIRYIENLKPITGRVNFLNYNQNYKIILDYAHTTKATEEILHFANKIKKNKIITVLGCAGGRFSDKRKEIGFLATEFSDIAIFTMDDPRNEKLENIFSDMLQNVKRKNYLLINDRKKAISKALDIAEKDDIVLILGKGQDDYMAIKNKYKKYNDLDTLNKYFNVC